MTRGVTAHRVIRVPGVPFHYSVRNLVGSFGSLTAFLVTSGCPVSTNLLLDGRVRKKLYIVLRLALGVVDHNQLDLADLTD